MLPRGKVSGRLKRPRSHGGSTSFILPMGTGFSAVDNERLFQLSDNREWIYVTPDDIYIPIRSIAFVKIHQENTYGYARIMLRLVDNSSADNRYSSTQGQFHSYAIDTLSSMPIPLGEAQQLVRRFTGFRDKK